MTRADARRRGSRAGGADEKSRHPEHEPGWRQRKPKEGSGAGLCRKQEASKGRWPPTGPAASNWAEGLCRAAGGLAAASERLRPRAEISKASKPKARCASERECACVVCVCVCVCACVCAGGDSVRLPPFLSLSVLACPVLLRLLARSPSLHPPPLSSSLPFPPLPFPSLLVADPVCAPAPSTRHGEHSRPCAHQAISAASGRRNEPAARAQTCVSTQQPAQRCQPAQPSQLAVACCRRPSPPPPLHCRLQWTSGRHARRTLRVCTAIGLSWSRLPAPSAAAFRTPASPAASVLLRGPVGSDFDLARTSPSRAAAAVDDDSYLSHPLAFRHLRIPTADRLDAAAPATVSASPLNDSSADISQQPRLWTTYSLSHVPERTHPTNHSPT